MTTLDKQQIDRNGIILLRFIKPDGTYHRTSIMPGQDADAQMQAVNNHLEQMGHTKVGDDDLSVIRNTVTREHTKERVDAFKAAQAARDAEISPNRS
jgi:hypothetical protein